LLAVGCLLFVLASGLIIASIVVLVKGRQAKSKWKAEQQLGHYEKTPVASCSPGRFVCF